MSTGRIEKTVLLRAPRERIWRALTDSAEFGSWFGVRFDAAFAPGAIPRGVIMPTKVDAEVAKLQKPYEGKAFEITVEEMEPEAASPSAGTLRPSSLRRSSSSNSRTLRMASC